MTEAEFRAELATQGIEAYKAHWPPGRLSPEHAHDFNARGYVLAGEFTLTAEGVARRLTAGCDFKLAAGTPHTEHAGPDGTHVVAGKFSAG